MAKLITLENVKALLSKLTNKFATKEELKEAVGNRVTVSVEPSDGTETWIEVPVENLIVGGAEPTDTNALWLEVKE